MCLWECSWGASIDSDGALFPLDDASNRKGPFVTSSLKCNSPVSIQLPTCTGVVCRASFLTVILADAGLFFRCIQAVRQASLLSFTPWIGCTRGEGGRLYGLENRVKSYSQGLFIVEIVLRAFARALDVGFTFEALCLNCAASNVNPVASDALSGPSK